VTPPDPGTEPAAALLHPTNHRIAASSCCGQLVDMLPRSGAQEGAWRHARAPGRAFRTVRWGLGRSTPAISNALTGLKRRNHAKMRVSHGHAFVPQSGRCRYTSRTGPPPAGIVAAEPPGPPPPPIAASGSCGPTHITMEARTTIRAQSARPGARPHTPVAHARCRAVIPPSSRQPLTVGMRRTTLGVPDKRTSRSVLHKGATGAAVVASRGCSRA
ncbi:MAG: hypothetical protein QOI83_1104, partial [Streptomycetaceae bacterium]|nr:hypothetical protein [Streptomycetaceae bacterium]